MKTLSLILPAYNEERRLPRTFDLLKEAIAGRVFQGFELKEILVVDDGSKDQTQAVTQSHQKLIPALRCVRVDPNQGKGNAIHAGLRAATGEWCLIADADTATPWNQFTKLYQYCVTAKPSASIAIGSRDLPESDVRTKQSWLRENMGRTFNLLVRLITQLPFRDTQCGFKLIERSAIQKFLPDLEVKRFAWDVEFLMFARKYGLAMVEVPVTWEHQDASSVNKFKDSIEMLARVIQMRFRLLFLKKKA
jgi:dolichyl-phosphate beta-glucosyltransferase